MGVLDKWLKSFLKGEPRPASLEGAPPQASAPTSGGGAAPDAPPSQPGSSQPASALDVLDVQLVRSRARLTMDAAGRAFAEGPELQVQLQALDGGGRSKAADGLLADALLVSPSRALRRQLAERLLDRGERAKARALLEKLVDLSVADGGDHSAFALTALGDIAEAEGDTERARQCYERVLALDITLPQP